jgi:hypothetical protein
VGSSRWPQDTQGPQPPLCHCNTARCVQQLPRASSLWWLWSWLGTASCASECMLPARCLGMFDTLWQHFAMGFHYCMLPTGAFGRCRPDGPLPPYTWRACWPWHACQALHTAQAPNVCTFFAVCYMAWHQPQLVSFVWATQHMCLTCALPPVAGWCGCCSAPPSGRPCQAQALCHPRRQSRRCFT